MLEVFKFLSESNVLNDKIYQSTGENMLGMKPIP